MKIHSEEPKRIRNVCQFCKGLYPIQNEIRLCKTAKLNTNKSSCRIFLPKELNGKQVEIVFSKDDLQSINS